MNQVVLDFNAATTAGILTKPMATTASSFTGNPIIGPSGHRVETIHRESGFDTDLPVKGTPASHDYSKLLKMDYPSFDGDNPTL